MEIELKLALPAAAIPRLLRHPALLGLKRGRSRTARLVATYFDTADHRLAALGVALRIRREGRAWVQAVKGDAGPRSGGGLAARSEHEWRMRSDAVRPGPDLARLADCEAGRTVARIARKHALVPRFVTDVVRRTVPLAFPDGTTALAAIDVGRVATRGTPRRRASLAEVELELVAGDPHRLFDLALVLAADLPLAVDGRSKAERGYALLVPPATGPHRAEPITFAAEASAPAACAAMLRNALRQIAANGAGVSGHDDIEWIHQLRIGVRRLRSALTLARPLLDPVATAHVVDDLRWLADELGPARDLDVFVTAALPAMREAARRTIGEHRTVEASLATLATRADRRRREARDAAARAVASRRYQRLLLAAGALAASLDRKADDRTVAPVSAFARDVLRRRHRKLRRSGRDLAGCSPADRHQFRIAAKKLRYATEFFAPCFPGRRLREYRRALADLQEVLGALNDAAVAATVAAELAEPGSPAAPLFALWSVAQDEAQAEALQRAWARCEATPAFWKR